MAKKAPEKISILVADDDVDILALVVGHLKGRAREIHQASDGEEALKLAREKKPDLVVLDVMMPGMSGWEVCRSIRDDATLRDALSDLLQHGALHGNVVDQQGAKLGSLTVETLAKLAQS